jgi:hypothetical protein
LKVLPCQACGSGAAPDVQVNELVEQRLERVAGTDAGVGGDREAELRGHRETEPVRAAAGAAHLQLRLACDQWACGEDRQPPQPLHLFTKVDPRDQEVGGMAPQLFAPSNL